MYLASQVSQWGKNPPEMQETQVPDLKNLLMKSLTFYVNEAKATVL